jgi:cytidylate kinase
MTLVALSASYGAGGTVIGPAVAAGLGVPFLDRAIPMRVAAGLEVPLRDADAHDEQASTSWLDRLLRGFIATDAGVPTAVAPEAYRAEDFRRETERVLLRQAATGEGVLLGRAAVIVLREHARTLRVRLDGPRERRVEQATRLAGVEREAAERALERLDRTHAQYARELYGVDISDPSLYHLTLDSTTLPIASCVELIVGAARALGPET